MIKSQGFFGDIMSVRGEFGYWVFTGHDVDQPAQRPSWNYRKGDGGGMIVDMLCHWRYVIDNMFGEVKAVSCLGATHIPERIDEQGKAFDCDTDDSCYATIELKNGIIVPLQLQLEHPRAPRRPADHARRRHQGLGRGWPARVLDPGQQPTPKPVWNPDIDSPSTSTVAGRRCQTLGHTTTPSRFSGKPLSATWRWATTSAGLMEGAKGVQFAELGLQSWAQRKWLDVPELG